MISSSKSVIKEWSPEKVRTFIPPLTVSQPVIRELDRRNLDEPSERKSAEAAEEFYIDEKLKELEAREREVQEADERAELELQAAREEAERLLEQAREEAELIKEEARQAGYEKGLKEGRQRGRAEALGKMEAVLEAQREQTQQELSETLKSIEQAKNKCIRDYLDQLRDCSFAVAEKVIHTSLEASGDIIKRMIVFETEKLRKTAWLKIYLEKLDYDMMMEADADLVTELTRVSDNIKFIVMEKEQRGSCIIETPEEILDIGVETQMENIREITGTIRA
ncbi:MAG: flagellar biosynthesis/type III secretory pathway protein [Lachnospiraceae bacterium]|nr:flagellar biosynthesis/type III secretory pathway protein [Lachnospiraceae bacterium]